MADRNREPAATRELFGFVEARVDRGESVHVVEKHVPLRQRHFVFARQCRADGRAGRPRIEKQEPPALEFRHHHRHAVAVGGEAASHVVVHPDIGGEPVQPPVEPSQNRVMVHADLKHLGAGIDVIPHRLHRHMDQELVTRGAGRRGLAFEPGRIGEERQRQRCAEADGAGRALAIHAQIVEDDRDRRPLARFGRWHREAAPRRPRLVHRRRDSRFRNARRGGVVAS